MRQAQTPCSVCQGRGRFSPVRPLGPLVLGVACVAVAVWFISEL
jgi:hypothetical protein